MTRALQRGAVLVVSITVVLFFGAFANAQDTSELEATIRAAIVSDPRSAEMTEAEIDAMVAALVSEAEGQGVTSEDITWRPQDPSTLDQESSSSAEACGYAAFLCALNDAFGFSGYPLLIPLLLGVSSALLLFVIGSILLHSHRHHPLHGQLQ